MQAVHILFLPSISPWRGEGKHKPTVKTVFCVQFPTASALLVIRSGYLLLCRDTERCRAPGVDSNVMPICFPHWSGLARWEWPRLCQRSGEGALMRPDGVGLCARVCVMNELRSDGMETQGRPLLHLFCYASADILDCREIKGQ